MNYRVRTLQNVWFKRADNNGQTFEAIRLTVHASLEVINPCWKTESYCKYKTYANQTSRNIYRIVFETFRKQAKIYSVDKALVL